jgi:hypothetical protein
MLSSLCFRGFERQREIRKRRKGTGSKQLLLPTLLQLLLLPLLPLLLLCLLSLLLLQLEASLDALVCMSSSAAVAENFAAPFGLMVALELSKYSIALACTTAASIA